MRLNLNTAYETDHRKSSSNTTVIASFKAGHEQIFEIQQFRLRVLLDEISSGFITFHLRLFNENEAALNSTFVNVSTTAEAEYNLSSDEGTVEGTIQLLTELRTEGQTQGNPSN